MTKLLMMDSGAISVWTKGARIHLMDYAEFAATYPSVSYYINLDEISWDPKNPNKIHTKAELEEDCLISWDNYWDLSKVLGTIKVLPVVHQSDPIRWLDKYLDKGIEYICLSPGIKNPMDVRKAWLDKVRKRIDFSCTRTHGLGVMSFELMEYFPWYSVDSTSWKSAANYGNIFVPVHTKDGYNFGKQPHVICVSPKSPQIHGKKHAATMTPFSQQLVKEYLHWLGISMGESEIIKAKENHKLSWDKGEIWYNKEARTLLRPLTFGVSNSFEQRCIANTRFYKRANQALKIDHIYFAGNPMPFPNVEYHLGRRLLSYHYIRDNQSSMKVFLGHLGSLLAHKEKLNGRRTC